MKILHVFKDYHPPTIGGIEQHMHDIAHMTQGFEFSVLTSSRTRHPVVDTDGPVTVVRAAEYARPVSTPITPSWVNFLRRSDADLMHFHMPNPFGEIAFLASRTKIPMVATYHSDIVGRRLLLPLFEPFQSGFLGKARKIIVSSENLAKASEPLRKHRNKLEVIPFGIDHSTWAQIPEATAEIRGSFRGPIVLFLGRLAYYKGVEVLIDAMRTVDATCLIVGDGPKRNELEAAALQKGVEGKIYFIGEIDDKLRSAYYHAADVFVLPSTSRAETFGIAMVEAMACETPAICTQVGTGTDWVNLHNVTGLVVPPKRSDLLAKALNDLLADNECRTEMGKAARQRVIEHFSRDQMVESLSKLYRSI